MARFWVRYLQDCFRVLYVACAVVAKRFSVPTKLRRGSRTFVFDLYHCQAPHRLHRTPLSKPYYIYTYLVKEQSEVLVQKYKKSFSSLNVRQNKIRDLVIVSCLKTF